MSTSKHTTDHEEIRQWVESRKGKPVSIEGTERRGEKAGLLRIDFPEARATRRWNPFRGKHSLRSSMMQISPWCIRKRRLMGPKVTSASSLVVKALRTTREL